MQACNFYILIIELNIQNIELFLRVNSEHKNRLFNN